MSDIVRNVRNVKSVRGKTFIRFIFYPIYLFPLIDLKYQSIETETAKQKLNAYFVNDEQSSALLHPY